MHEPHVIRYAAIDSCATFWLWTSINSYLETSNASSIPDSHLPEPSEP
jgi:hypothetical protein